MKILRGRLVAGAVLLVGLFVLGTRVIADANTNGDILKVADALQKGDTDAAKQAAQAVAKADLDVIMEIFKPSAKGGAGIGPKGPKDGIEKKIQELDKAALKNAKAEAEALTRAGYISAAVAEAIMDKVPADKKRQGAQW